LTDRRVLDMIASGLTYVEAVRAMDLQAFQAAEKKKKKEAEGRLVCKHLLVRFKTTMPDRGEICKKGWSISKCGPDCPDYEED